MPAIRVLIADDHAVLRVGLRMLLEAQPDIEVAGEASDGVELPRKARELRPDVVLMDLSMPGPHSGALIRQVLQASPGSRILVLTMHDDPAYLSAALAAGATGYLVKTVADSELVLAIRAVHAGRLFTDLTAGPGALPPRGTGGARAFHVSPKALSRREQDVLRLLAQGLTNQQVADGIHVSVKTVETYRTRIREKLGLRTRADLYRFAAEAGILDADGVEPPDGR